MDANFKERKMPVLKALLTGQPGTYGDERATGNAAVSELALGVKFSELRYFTAALRSPNHNSLLQNHGAH